MRFEYCYHLRNNAFIIFQLFTILYNHYTKVQKPFYSNRNILYLYKQ